MKEIRLDTMDGYQFQEFVASLFKQLGFLKVKVGPRGADKGIDITMEQKSGIDVTVRFLVQCKHHPKGVIGRPVVQKLHSAVIYTPTLDKGIIVTTGRFSSQAIKYAEEVGIELMDGEKLKELGKKAGLSVLYEKPPALIENCFPISDKSKVIEKLVEFLKLDLMRFSEELFGIDEIDLKLIPTYMIDFSVNATFSTSVGVIHSINERSSIFLLGDTGDIVHHIVSSFLLPLKWTILQLDEKMLKDIKITERRKFVKSFKEIKEMAKDVLIRAYTKTVSYYGANNVLYHKTCVPKKRHTNLLDIKRVYFPSWDILFSLKDKKYIIMALECSEQFEALPSSFIPFEKELTFEAYPDRCMLCSKELKRGIQEKYLCNECGAITCDKDSSICKMCQKVVCKNHTFTKRKFLIFHDKYCPQCAKKEGLAEHS